MIDSLHQVELGRVLDPELRDLWRADFEGRDYPELVPPVAGVFASVDGDLWLGMSAPPPDELGGGLSSVPRWLVVPAEVSRSGRLDPSAAAAVGVIELPPRSHPIWADHEGVLLLRIDSEFDIPFIEWYAVGSS